jgi:hypothetical protein
MAQHCGPSANLSAKHGAGRAAAISSAFHAHCAKSSEAARLFALLTDDEQEEINQWPEPPDVTVEGTVLRYADAEKELALGLDRFGFYADPTGPCLTVGHLDFAWVHVAADGHRMAYVADIKRSRWTTPDGPDSLQLHAYARAFCLLRGCTSYCTGIWAATDGLWMWSQEVVELESERGEALLDRILYAAGNSSTEYASGPHCDHCFSRLHCQEFAVPAHTAETWLTPIAGNLESGLAAMSPEARGEFLLKLKAMKKVIDAAEDQVNAATERGLDFIAGGKRWGMKQMPGRKSIDKARLASFLQGEGIAVTEFDKVGDPYAQGAWLKA